MTLNKEGFRCRRTWRLA